MQVHKKISVDLNVFIRFYESGLLKKLKGKKRHYLIVNIYIYIFILIIFIIILLYVYIIKLKKSWIINKIGKNGEKEIINILNKFNEKKYYVINDIILRHPNGKTTQIDHLVISRKRIFIIETKNYSGLIIGDVNNRSWTHVSGKSKHQMYNPIFQNKGHIKALLYTLKDELSKISYKKRLKIFISIITFKCNSKIKLKKPFFFKKDYKICKFNELFQYIKYKYRRKLISKNYINKLLLKLVQQICNLKKI